MENPTHKNVPQNSSNSHYYQPIRPPLINNVVPVLQGSRGRSKWVHKSNTTTLNKMRSSPPTDSACVMRDTETKLDSYLASRWTNELLNWVNTCKLAITASVTSKRILTTNTMKRMDEHFGYLAPSAKRQARSRVPRLLDSVTTWCNGETLKCLQSVNVQNFVFNHSLKLFLLVYLVVPQSSHP